MTERYDPFAGLELLPSPLLEEIIQTDFSGEANYSDDMIRYVLEILAKREREEHPEAVPNVQEAWAKLQLRMDAKEGFSAAPQKPSANGKKRIFRHVALVAACVAILFATLITAQGMGMDIFGALGTWTDNTFHFEAVTEDASTPMEEAVAEELSAMGIPTELFPAWIPEGYVFLRMEQSKLEAVKGLHVTYTKANGGKALTITVEKYFDTAFAEGRNHEKNSGDPFIYVKSGRQFYIFENSGTWTATWCDMVYGITICGAESKETAIAMIDSIGEFTREKTLDSDASKGAYAPVVKALSELELPAAFALAWIPEEYEFFCMDADETSQWKYVCVGYAKSGSDKALTIEIEEFFDRKLLSEVWYEKSPGAPEVYTGNGKQFYLFRNADTWTAVWSDTVYCITIAGVETKELAKAIIDSIPEFTEEATVGSNVYVPVLHTLYKSGLPITFAPTWIPEGYELIEVTPIGSVLNKGVAATYTYKGREQNLLIGICEYYDSAFLYDTVYEKNAGAPEEYQSNGRRFYLFRNVDTWTAVWSDGRYSISLGGMDSRETAVSIIDSIPELVQEQTSES